MGLYYVISVAIIIACVIMVLVVLVQNSKGGGLASNFQSQNQYMGVRKTTDFIEKATWTIGIVICVLSLISIFMIPRHSYTVDETGVDTELRGIIEAGEGDAAVPMDYQTPPAEE